MNPTQNQNSNSFIRLLENVGILSSPVSPLPENVNSKYEPLSVERVGESMRSGIPMLQLLKNGSEPAEQMKTGASEYLKMILGALQTGANEVIDKTTGKPAALNYISENELNPYSYGYGDTKSRSAGAPIYNSLMTILGGQGAVATPVFAASNPLGYLLSSLGLNAGLQGSGELLQSIRQKQTIPQGIENVASGVLGKGDISGLVSGIVGQTTPDTVKWDTAINLLSPIVLSNALANKKTTGYYNYRNELGQFAEKVKNKIKPPKPSNKEPVYFDIETKEKIPASEFSKRKLKVSGSKEKI